MQYFFQINDHNLNASVTGGRRSSLDNLNCTILNTGWGGYGIHGTDAPEGIGTAASNGCIRMLNEDVIELYDMVPLGTKVKIVGDVFTGRILYVGVPDGDDVQEVQAILRMAGYYDGEITGTYDELTRSAVQRFQQDYGISPDGIVGPITYENLRKVNDTLLDSRDP